MMMMMMMKKKKMTNLHQTPSKRRLPRVSRPMICANKFNRRNYLEAMRGKTCQTQTTECKNEQGICRTPKQPKPRRLQAIGEEEDQQHAPIQSKRKIRKMKNGREDAARVILCHDVW